MSWNFGLYVILHRHVLTLTAKTAESGDMKMVVNAIATLMEEADFTATPDKLTFRGMDPSHVAMVDVVLPSDAFESYECKEKTAFGVRIGRLADVIKRADKKDGIVIHVDDGRLDVTVGNNKNFSLKLLDAGNSNTPLPKIPFENKVSLPAAMLDKILMDVKVVDDYVTMSADGKKAVFSGKGDDGSASISIGEESGVEVSAGGTGSGTYSLEYIVPIIKAVAGVVKQMTCEFSGAKPLRLEFQFATTGKIHFYLAPRVEK